MRVAAVMLLILAIGLLVAAFNLPFWLAAPFVAYCLWMLRRRQRAELAMVVVSLWLAFGAIELYVRLNADDLFYREQEKWAIKGRYRANVHDTLHARFGDLIAMDPSLEPTLAEPHDVVFASDSLGFRNDHDYAGEPYVLLGDSFTATAGTTQTQTLVAQINARHPGTGYTLGYPGAPWDYEVNALRFMRITGAAPRFLWFVFEGNDFASEKNKDKKYTIPTRLEAWRDAFSVRALPFLATRVFGSLFKAVGARVDALSQEPQPSKVQVYEIAGKPVGFFKEYIDAATQSVQAFNTIGNPDVLAHTACVFFVPDKYRVYKPWIKDGPALPEPAPGAAELTRYFAPHHIPVIDLTLSLRNAAKARLKEGKLVYWRDDTHWNPLGIASVQNDIDRCIAHDRAR